MVLTIRTAVNPEIFKRGLVLVYGHYESLYKQNNKH